MNTPSPQPSREIVRATEHSLAMRPNTDVASINPQALAMTREAMRSLLVPNTNATREQVKAALATPEDRGFEELAAALNIQNVLLAHLATAPRAHGQITGGEMTITRKEKGVLKVFVTTDRGNEHYTIDAEGQTSGMRSNRDQALAGEGTWLTAADLNRHLRTFKANVAN
ncbi:hypothetical protein KA517_05085 [Candidatus Gracilibacteria bacterium]|nr:hypothetical protein [Candidatus Gracilibacteria bacterium]